MLQDDEQSDVEKDEALRQGWERVEFLREFWPSGDACAFILKLALATLGISTRSLSGPYTPALLPNAMQFSANSSEADLSRPLLLGDAMGLLFTPYSDTHCGRVTQHPMPWLQIKPFESLRSTNNSEKLRVLQWYAQSHDRHRLATAALKVLMSSQSRLEGDIGMARALIELESTQVCSKDGAIEAEGAAGKRGHSAAKRWLAGRTANPQVWSAFAALEARRGRYKQALNVRVLTPSCKLLASSSLHSEPRECGIDIVTMVTSRQYDFCAGAVCCHE